MMNLLIQACNVHHPVVTIINMYTVHAPLATNLADCHRVTPTTSSKTPQIAPSRQKRNTFRVVKRMLSSQFLLTTPADDDANVTNDVTGFRVNSQTPVNSLFINLSSIATSSESHMWRKSSQWMGASHAYSFRACTILTTGVATSVNY